MHAPLCVEMEGDQGDGSRSVPPWWIPSCFTPSYFLARLRWMVKATSRKIRITYGEAYPVSRVKSRRGLHAPFISALRQPTSRLV